MLTPLKRLKYKLFSYLLAPLLKLGAKLLNRITRDNNYRDTPLQLYFFVCACVNDWKLKEV